MVLVTGKTHNDGLVRIDSNQFSVDMMVHPNPDRFIEINVIIFVQLCRYIIFLICG